MKSANSYKVMEISFMLKETDHCVGREEHRMDISFCAIALLL